MTDAARLFESLARVFQDVPDKFMPNPDAGGELVRYRLAEMSATDMTAAILTDNPIEAPARGWRRTEAAARCLRDTSIPLSAGEWWPIAIVSASPPGGRHAMFVFHLAPAPGMDFNDTLRALADQLFDSGEFADQVGTDGEREGSQD